GLKREAESPSLPPETGSGAFRRQQRLDLALVVGSRILGDSGLVAAGRLIQHGKEDGDFGEDRFLFVRGADFLQARLDRGADRAIGKAGLFGSDDPFDGRFMIWQCSLRYLF